jgi:hypothetical protein
MQTIVDNLFQLMYKMRDGFKGPRTKSEYNEGEEIDLEGSKEGFGSDSGFRRSRYERGTPTSKAITNNTTRTKTVSLEVEEV